MEDRLRAELGGLEIFGTENVIKRAADLRYALYDAGVASRVDETTVRDRWQPLLDAMHFEMVSP